MPGAKKRPKLPARAAWVGRSPGQRKGILAGIGIRHQQEVLMPTKSRIPKSSFFFYQNNLVLQQRVSAALSNGGGAWRADIRRISIG